MSRVWVRVAGSVAITVVLLMIVPIDRVWAAIRSVSPWVWASSVVVFVGGHSLNALKLHLLLGSPVVPVGACLRAHFAGMAANLGLPGVAGGDLVRAASLVSAAGAARITLVAIVDRVVDAAALVLLVAVAAPLAGVPPTIADHLRATAWWLLALGVAAAMTIFVVRRWWRRRAGLPRLGEAWASLRDRPGAVGLAVAISLLVQTAFVLTNIWLAFEVGLATPIGPWFLAWTGAKLSAVLPISFGGLGVREAALVSILAAYGFAAEGVLAVGILWDGALIVGSLGGFLAMQVLWRGTPVQSA
jgi:glycosyltransferase 2 family protein